MPNRHLTEDPPDPPTLALDLLNLLLNTAADLPHDIEVIAADGSPYVVSIYPNYHDPEHHQITAGRTHPGHVIRLHTTQGPVIIGVTESWAPPSTATPKEWAKIERARQHRNPPGFVTGYRFHPDTGEIMNRGRISRYRAHRSQIVYDLGRHELHERPAEPPTQLPKKTTYEGEQPPDVPL